MLKKLSLLAVVSAIVAGCASQPPSPTVSSAGLEAVAPSVNAQQRLREQLAQEPAQCHDYRRSFVNAFAANVQGLSLDDENLQADAQTQFDAAREQLQQAGVARSECRLPRCIIEPLQGGKLTYWCGFRLAGREGEAVNQWVEFNGNSLR